MVTTTLTRASARSGRFLRRPRTRYISFAAVRWKSERKYTLEQTRDGKSDDENDFSLHDIRSLFRAFTKDFCRLCLQTPVLIRSRDTVFIRENPR